MVHPPADSEASAELIAGPFEVVAKNRDETSNAWGVLLEWRDNDGRRHQWALARALLAGDASEVRARLLDGGLYVSSSPRGRARLTDYLTSVRVSTRARCADRTGWQGDAFAVPGKTFGDAGGEMIVMQTAGTIAEFDLRGTMDDWAEGVARVAVGNSRLALALSAAFAGPLLKLIGEESFGFHFSGESSSGKTTALRAASSVWGNSVKTWRMTDNAAENLARDSNDGLLLLDESSQADGQAFDAMTYMLGNGQGKSRMRRDATAKPLSSWRLVFLSTGEIGLAEKIGEAGKKVRAGQSVRMIEIPADAGAGHKLFDTLHGFATGDALARSIKDAADRNRGHAAPVYLDRLTSSAAEIAREVKAHVGSWVSMNLPPNADGQVSRVAARFALVAAAGQIAIDAGILPWPDGEAGRAAATCFKAWINMRGGAGAAEAEDGVSQVRAFIEAHGMSRLSPIRDDYDADESKTINRVGFRRKDDLGRWEYLIMSQSWASEVCKGLNATAVARELVRRGLMTPGRDGKHSTTARIPGLNKPRVYLINASILDEEP